MTRVLMGDFTALQRLGLEDVLLLDGIDLLEVPNRVVAEQLVDVLPDAVVLDWHAAETCDLVRLITHDYPVITVIACSSVVPLMRVFPSMHRGESYTTHLEPALLTGAIRA